MCKERVLIVEDSKFQGIIIKDILSKSGYDAVWVTSAEEALNNNIYNEFDLVLLDVILPGINGYEFCKIIKKSNAILPVIILTSMDDEKGVVKALGSGADDYIKKPYSIDELIARIKVQMRTRKLQVELINKNNELKKAYYTIKRMSITDILTGAYNRAYINEYIEKLNKNNDEIDIACIMLDIDNFKKVNDTYGHLTGDEVLKNVVSICSDNINGSGITVRFGGEEFLIILKDNIQDINKFAEGIRHQCEKSRLYNLKYTVSLGGNIFKLHRLRFFDDFQEGLKEADKMLYNSKNKGKNKVTIKEKDRAAI